MARRCRNGAEAPQWCGGAAMIGDTRSREEMRGRRSVAKGLAGLAFASGALASRRAIGEAPQPSRETMASNPPREIQTLIDNHVNGFNTQNIEHFLGVFGDTAIIIDGIAPYRWLNPNAPANWLADVTKWREDLGVTYEHLSVRNGVLECGGLQCVCRHIGNAQGNHQGPNRRSDRHPRIYIFKARRGVEDRRAGLGAHVVRRDYKDVHAYCRASQSSNTFTMSAISHSFVVTPAAIAGGAAQ